MHIFRGLAVILIFSLFAGACTGGQAGPLLPVELTGAPVVSSSAAAPVSAPWPTHEWQVSTPGAQGMDAPRLAEMLADIQKQQLGLHSLLIFRNGYLVSENYFNGSSQDDLHDIFSCTKSFVATLVGVALDQGMITSVDQKVLDFFPGRTFKNMDGRKQAMTLANVLTMTSGLQWTDTGRAFQDLYASGDWTAFMLDLPMDAAPGDRWNYCSGCSHLLTTILEQAAPEGMLKFAQKNLFEPLGIKDYRWEQDAQGVPIGGWGLRMTARDMGKLGYLYLNDGRWDGQQVVSDGWVQQAIQGRYDTGTGLRYGYQWWADPTHDAYYALGRDGQTIFVYPGKNLIVVTTAELDGHSQIFELISTYIIPSVR